MTHLSSKKSNWVAVFIVAVLTYGLMAHLLGCQMLEPSYRYAEGLPVHSGELPRGEWCTIDGSETCLRIDWVMTSSIRYTWLLPGCTEHGHLSGDVLFEPINAPCLAYGGPYWGKLHWTTHGLTFALVGASPGDTLDLYFQP